MFSLCASTKKCRIILKSLKFIQMNCFTSEVQKPTITVPLKWQKQLARDMNKKNQLDKLKKSQQGNTKVPAYIAFLTSKFLV